MIPTDDLHAKDGLPRQVMNQRERDSRNGAVLVLVVGVLFWALLRWWLS